MGRKWLLVTIAAGAIPFAANAMGDMVHVVAKPLAGAAEVPGPGDDDGQGMFTGRIDMKQNKLCYTLTAMKIGPATAAHVHKGTVGKDGPPAITLKAPTSVAAEACVQADHAVLMDIAAHPAQYYVNVHDEAHPKGAIRGQLMLKP